MAKLQPTRQYLAGVHHLVEADRAVVDVNLDCLEEDVSAQVFDELKQVTLLDGTALLSEIYF